MRFLRFTLLALLWLAVGTAFADDLMLLGVGPRASVPASNFLVQEDGSSKFLLEDVADTIGTPVALGNNQSNNGTSLVITTTAPAPAGDSIFVIIATGGTADNVSAVTDSAGNTYVRDKDLAAPSNVHAYAYRSAGIATLSSGGTITITHSVAVQTTAAAIEVANVVPSSPLDQTGSAAGNSTTPSASATTLATSDLVLGMVGWGNFNLTQPGGAWNALTGNTAASTCKVGWAYQANMGPSTYTYDPTLSLGADWSDLITSYKAAGVASTDAILLE